MCKSFASHNGLVRLHGHAHGVRHQLAHAQQLLRLDARFVFHPIVLFDDHHHFFQRGVSGALAYAVDRAFDLSGTIVESLRKTNRIVFVDEDVPGGTTAYMMQEVLEKQKGYDCLDSAPRTLPGKPHRPAYGSDGDYWSKPNVETIFDAVYDLMHEADPKKYP